MSENGDFWCIRCRQFWDNTNGYKQGGFMVKDKLCGPCQINTEETKPVTINIRESDKHDLISGLNTAYHFDGVINKSKLAKRYLYLSDRLKKQFGFK